MAIKQKGKVTHVVFESEAGGIRNSNTNDLDTYEFSSADVISGGPLRIGQEVKFVSNKERMHDYFKNYATEIEGL